MATPKGIVPVSSFSLVDAHSRSFDSSTSIQKHGSILHFLLSKIRYALKLQSF